MKYIDKTNIFYLESILLIMLNFMFFLNMYLGMQLKYLIYDFVLILYIIYLFKNTNYQIDKYFYLYMIYFLFLLFLGYYNGNFESYIYMDFICFLSIIFMLISCKFSYRFFTSIYPKLGVYINLLAIFFSVLYVLKNGIYMPSIKYGRGLDNIEEGMLMSPKSFLICSLFLYPLIKYLNSKTDKIIYHIAIFMYLFFSLAMASRGTTLVAIFVLVATHLFVKNNTNFNLMESIKHKYIFFVLLLLVVVVAYQIPSVRSAIDYLIFRFQYGEEYLGASRSEEAQDIIQHLTINQLLFGKGFGGANIYWIFDSLPHGANLVHYGWIFLILKGGILLLCFIYGKILLAIKSMWKNDQKRPYSIALIAFLLLESSHTNFNAFHTLSFMFIALSFSFYNRKMIQ